MYYLLIDSTGEREKIAIPFVLNESPYNFSSYSLEWGLHKTIIRILISVLNNEQTLSLQIV